MMKRLLLSLLALCAIACGPQGNQYHVSIDGDDEASGSLKAPFRTISRAARAAEPGDTITVHEGTYREWVDPPRGGTSDARRIVYRAAAGERVELKGSEVISGWEQTPEGIWKKRIPNNFFGEFNPYREVIFGDWFFGGGRPHHLGEVFLNGKALYEKESLDKLIDPQAPDWARDKEGSLCVWYCECDDEATTLWANFRGADPNLETVEISVRPTCFYPSEPGIDYITLSGFRISQAATQWGAPTAEQIGMIATHWNRGWIIENNIISDSKCSGITLGKERGTGHNVWSADPSIDGSLHYIETTFRVLRNGWTRDRIGSHIVRGNVIFNCGQTGICGSMGCAFSVVENNHIYDIWRDRSYSGAEIAGIKFHAPIDTRISGNRIHNTGRGIWLDWMTQGVRVSRNLLYDNDIEDLFVEVNHGPFLVDNNILCSPLSLADQSHGGAYVHNLFLGKLFPHASDRHTPYHLPHSTEVAGLATIRSGDVRYLNNIFIADPVAAATQVRDNGAFGMTYFETARYPVLIDGNVYYAGVPPYGPEKNRVVNDSFDPRFRLDERTDGVYLSFEATDLSTLQTTQVTTERLGEAKFPRQRFETPEGLPVTIDSDYLQLPRGTTPTAGPFENLRPGRNEFKVW